MANLTEALSLDEAIRSFHQALNTSIKWIDRTVAEKSRLPMKSIHDVTHLIDDQQVEMFKDYWRDIRKRRRAEQDVETQQQQDLRDQMFDEIRILMMRYLERTWSFINLLELWEHYKVSRD